MNESTIFSSLCSLRFKDKIVESLYKSNQERYPAKYTLYLMGPTALAGLATCIVIWTAPEKTKFNLRNPIRNLLNYLGVASMIILILLSYTRLRRKSWFNWIIKYYGYIIIAFILEYLRSNLLSLELVDYGMYCLIVLLEFVFKMFFFRLKIIDHAENAYLTILDIIGFWASYFFVRDDNPGLYLCYTMYTEFMFAGVFGFYLVTKGKKLSFYYHNIVDKQNVWYRGIINNMNNGFIHVKGSQIEYINKVMKDKVRDILTSQEFGEMNDRDDRCISIKSNVELISSDKDRDAAEDIKEQSSKILHFILPDDKHYLITEKDNNFKTYYEDSNFNSIGVKTVCSKTAEGEVLRTDFEVFCRYYLDSGEDNYDFIFNDISRVKMVEEKNAEFKYKTLFLSKVAHEFKNPLVCITELVDQSVESVKVGTQMCDIKTTPNEQLSIIKALSNYMLILIKDLDYFSRFQLENKVSTEISAVKISEVFQFCQEVGQALLKKSDKRSLVDFVYNMDYNVPKVINTDEYKLKQVLINLISNSVKFTNRGSIVLSCKVTSCQIVFSVEDTGTGIDKNREYNLFKPFVKSEDPENKIGTGLGLVIVKDLVKLLGSEDIYYSSKMTKGSRFWFSIPLKSQKAHENNIYNTYDYRTLSNSSMQSVDLNLNNRTESLFIDVPMYLNRSPNVFDISNETIKVENLMIKVPQEFTGRQVRNHNRKSTKFSYKLEKIRLTKSGFYHDSNLKDNSTFTIIVTDDEMLTRQSTVRVFAKFAESKNIKINFIQAQDGVEMLYHCFQNLYVGKRVDAVFSDETMKCINGSAAAKILKESVSNKFHENIPYYIITAYEDREQIKIQNGNYVMDVFTKPLKQDEAETILSHLIKRQVTSDV